MLRILGSAITLVQLLDIIIHAATDQLELLRVSSNIIIVIWLMVVAMRKVKTNVLPAAALAIGAYLILNVIFLAMEGITNAQQGSGLRVALFVLAFLTVTLSGLFVYIQGKR
jgi:hypothetical protein